MTRCAMQWTVLAALGVVLGCVGNTQSAGGYAERGEKAWRDRRLEVALAEFQRAVKLNPELASAHANLGVVYKELGDLPSAAGSLETAVRLDPYDFFAMFELGEVYRLMGDLARSIRAYVLAVKLKPQDFDAQFRLATVYHENGDAENAIECYRVAVELDKRDPHVWSNLGALYDAQGKHYEAITAYKESLERDVNQPVVLVNLATVYIHQQRLDTAKLTLEAALRQNPQLSLAHERMGYVLWRDGEIEEAARCYLRAIEIGDTFGRAYAGFGVVRMTQYLQNPALEQYRVAAIEAWHQSLERDPQQPKLRALIEKYQIRRPDPVFSIE